MDRPLREGLDYWVPVAHATLLGALDVGGNLLENFAAAVAQRQRRQRAPPPPGDADADADETQDDDPRTLGAPVVDLSGHTAIVTGGNTGIGLTTARKLAERGCTVVVACRDARRGADAVALLRAAARRPLPGCKPGAAEDARLDLTSLDSVRGFARQFNASGRPLSILVCNAGVMSPPQRLSTGDGLELQLQTNAIGHWLLAHELLAHQRRRRATAAAAAAGAVGAGEGGWGGSGSSSKAAAAAAAGFLLPPEAATAEAAAPAASLEAAATAAAGIAPGTAAAEAGATAGGGPAPPTTTTTTTLAIAPPGRGTRVVVISSLTHHAGSAQWEDKQSLRRYGPFVSYALSKLAGVICAAELQRRFDAHRRSFAAGGEEERDKRRRRRYDGCPGSPLCPGCVVCAAEAAAAAEGEESGGGGGRGKKKEASSPVVFGRDTAISLHPGIVATGLATGFFERTAAAVVPPGKGGSEGGGDAGAAGAATATATATTAAAPADAATPTPSHASPLSPLLERLYPWLLRSPEAAGDGVLKACLAPDDAAAGTYWHNGRPSRASAFARDPKRGAELWDYAVALCGAEETDESLSK
jgi:NAD(P)-dependent dehydrogenase (short-subunit alcohol dehydrogenase family)